MNTFVIILQSLWLTITPQDIAHAAEQLHDPNVVYTPDYQVIDYPMGDVPQDQGVCTDVIVRAFRELGVDLQVEVNNITHGDTNIDHRRVPNIAQYLEQSEDWDEVTTTQPGDVIWWKLGGTVNHVGIVTTNGFVMHNIGRGQVADVKPDDYTIYKVYRLNSHSQ